MKIEKIKILVAEDDQTIRSLIEDVLSEENFEIYSCNDGFEAIEILKEQDIQIIISDLLMPNIDGLELYEFNIKNENLPFILMSAGPVHRKNDLKKRFQDNPLNLIIDKPFSIEELLGALDICLKKL